MLLPDIGRSGLRRLLLALVVLGFTLPAAAASPEAGADVAAIAEPGDDPLSAESLELVERLKRAGQRISELEQASEQASGSRRRILDEQLWNAQLEFQRLLRALGENLVQQQREGRDIRETRALLTERVERGWPRMRERLERREARLEVLRPRRDEAAGEERIALEKEFSAEVERILASYEVLVDASVVFASVGLDVGEIRAYLTEKLAYRADELAAATRVALRAREDVRARLARSPGDAELTRKLEAEDERVDRVTDALSSIASLMDQVDLETAPYRQILVEATGEITTDVLDVDVALGLVERWRARIVEDLESQGPRWLLKGFLFLLILAMFRALAALTRRIVSHSVSDPRIRMSQLLRDTLVWWSSKAVMAVGVLVGLSQLGVQIGPLLAGLGIAGFIMGFALQDSLSNFAAGAMILAYRPYDVGDVIEAGGVRGKVSRMSLVSTTFLTFDNQTLIVPNSKIWGDVIRNDTAQKVRRIDLVFGVSYDTDVDHAQTVFRDILAKNEKVLAEPEPIVEVQKLGDSSVEFAVRPWVRTQDYWPTYWALMREAKKRLDQEGIKIPFPQRDVHLHVADGSAQDDAPAGS